jgi:peptide deformylase
MTKLAILNYPDPRLHKVAKPVQEVNAEIRRLVQDMAETMYAAPGIGLAATQVDRHIQLLIIDITKEQNNLQVFINPKIIEKSGTKDYEEGCLSVPGVYDTVLEAEGLLSVCIQHEMDHLLGKVFVEYLSPLKRTRIKTKMLKQVREISRNSY